MLTRLSLKEGRTSLRLIVQRRSERLQGSAAANDNAPVTIDVTA